MSEPAPSLVRSVDGRAASGRTRTAGVSLLMVAGLVVLGACGGGGATSPAPPTGLPAPTVTAAPPAAATPEATFGFQALWPFQDVGEVSAWQVAYRSGGHQPWHLDPAVTASGFAAAMGLPGLDEVTSTELVGDQAWVGVGYALPYGSRATAAVVHLVRMGTGEDAPWEVVGTRDGTFTLDTPAYGRTVPSPLTAGGEITGVDESIRVQARAGGSAELLGESCCVPAGGERQRWSATIAVPGSGPVTIVASTGGHAAQVERFAVTGVRVG